MYNKVLGKVDKKFNAMQNDQNDQTIPTPPTPRSEASAESATPHGPVVTFNGEKNIFTRALYQCILTFWMSFKNIHRLYVSLKSKNPGIC